MKRALRIITLLGVATLLAACSKCGEPIRLFDLPASCSDSQPQG